MKSLCLLYFFIPRDGKMGRKLYKPITRTQYGGKGNDGQRKTEM